MVEWQLFTNPARKADSRMSAPKLSAVRARMSNSIMLPALLQNRPTTQQLPATPTLGYRALADFVGIIAATGFDATQSGSFVFPPVAPPRHGFIKKRSKFPSQPDETSGGTSSANGTAVAVIISALAPHQCEDPAIDAERLSRHGRSEERRGGRGVCRHGPDKRKIATPRV